MRPADSTEFGDEDENEHEHVKRYLARTLMKANKEASVVKRNIATEARLWTKGATVASVIAAALAFPAGPVPASIQTLLDTADAWFLANTPAVCTSGSSCGTQKTWAAILDDYNNGVYPGGPQHCE